MYRIIKVDLHEVLLRAIGKPGAQFSVCVEMFYYNVERGFGGWPEQYSELHEVGTAEATRHFIDSFSLEDTLNFIIRKVGTQWIVNRRGRMRKVVKGECQLRYERWMAAAKAAGKSHPAGHAKIGDDSPELRD